MPSTPRDCEYSRAMVFVSNTSIFGIPCGAALGASEALRHVVHVGVRQRRPRREVHALLAQSVPNRVGLAAIRAVVDRLQMDGNEERSSLDPAARKSLAKLVAGAAEVLLYQDAVHPEHARGPWGLNRQREPPDAAEALSVAAGIDAPRVDKVGEALGLG